MRPRSVKGQTKFAGRHKGLPLLGSRPVDRVRCDRLDFQLGFYRDANGVSCYRNTYRGSDPTAAAALASVEPWQLICHALETIPYPPTGPIKATGWRPGGPLQLSCELG